MHKSHLVEAIRNLREIGRLVLNGTNSQGKDVIYKMVIYDSVIGDERNIYKQGNYFIIIDDVRMPYNAFVMEIARRNPDVVFLIIGREQESFKVIKGMQHFYKVTYCEDKFGLKEVISNC